MRLTPDLLLKYTHDFVRGRCEVDRSIVAAFLSGSLLDGSPLWCEVADVDVVFIHNAPPQTEREIAVIVGDTHFDIRHHDQGRYEPARQVRTDARLGPLVFAARPLHDPRHFLDFVQAGVRAQYHRPEYAWQRAAPLFEAARARWFALQGMAFDAAFMGQYLEAVELSARAAALLAGRALAPRRFAQQLQEALDVLGWEAAFQGFLGVTGALAAAQPDLLEMLPAWEAAWKACSGPEWSPHRLAYYRSGVQTFLVSAEPHLGVWPLLYTWARAAAQAEPARSTFEAACAALGLAQPEERLAALDAYLDTLSEATEGWARRNGVM